MPMLQGLLKAPSAPVGGSRGAAARVPLGGMARNVVTCAKRSTKTQQSTAVYEMDSEAKAKALSDALTRMQQRFGEGSVMRLSDSPLATVETFPSGSLALDAALGGGYPRGRLIEIYGPEASGKTTLAMHAAAEMQRLGGVVGYIDVEHAFDRTYAQNLGIDLERFYYCQPTTGEEALELMDEMCRSNAFDLAVVDSVAALVPRAELEGDIGNLQIGAQARLLSQALRKLSASASKSKTTLIFINQLRNKVGIMFGSPETTSGGQALKYYSSIRIDVRKKEAIMAPGSKGKEGHALGNRVRAKVVKNKVAPPSKEAHFEIYYGRGIDWVGGLFEAAEKLGVISRAGSSYRCSLAPDGKLAVGRDKSLQVLSANPELLTAVEAAVRAKLAEDPDAALDDITDEYGASAPALDLGLGTEGDDIDV